MPGQSPNFYYDPNARGTSRQYDQREGWFGRKQRQGGDIELVPETEQLNMPTPPPAPDTLRAVEILRQSRPSVPDFDNPAPNVVRGDIELEQAPPSAFSGVSRQNALQGLAGFQARQADQFSPFGEMELHRLATRDPNMVAPGSNQMWAGKFNELRGNRLGAEDVQRKALAGIQGAVAETHPAVQFNAEQRARRASMPATITAQGQFRAAQEAANSRRDVGEAHLEGRRITSQHNTLDTVMNAIRAIRAKSGGLTGDDAVQLRALENLYDILSEPLTGATFDEATEGFEE